VISSTNRSSRACTWSARRALPVGAVKTAWLSREQQIDGFALVMKVELYDNGKLHEGLVARPRKIGDATVRGSVTLYPSGALHDGRLDHPQQIDGVYLQDSVSLFEDGRLQGGNLAEDQTVGHRLLSRGAIFECRAPASYSKCFHKRAMKPA